MKRILNSDPDRIIITWNLTTTCNFSCEYCPDYLHDGRYGFPNFEKTLEFIKTIVNKNKKVFIELLGGEPTLWPDLINFMKNISMLSDDVIVHIGTNGSRTNRWWQHFCNAGVEMNSFIAFSYHPDSIDDELYYNNLKTASEKHFVISSFMLDPRHVQRTKKLFDKIKTTLPVDCVFKIIRPNFHSSQIDPRYTKEDLELFKSKDHEYYYDRKIYNKASNIVGEKVPGQLFLNGDRQNFRQMVIDKQHKFQGWKCYAGSKRLFINPDSSVWACSQVVGDKNMYLGNINENVNLFNDYVICPVQYCSCMFDAIVEKFTDE